MVDFYDAENGSVEDRDYHPGEHLSEREACHPS